MVSRTAERVLAIIAIVLSVIGAAGTVLLGVFFKMGMQNPQIMEEMRREIMREESLSAAEFDIAINTIGSLQFVLWIAAAAAAVSIVLAIIGTVKLRSNVKTAGTLFIVSGLLAGILTLPSILLYIAGILCFVKKDQQAPGAPEDQYADGSSGWMN